MSNGFLLAWLFLFSNTIASYSRTTKGINSPPTVVSISPANNASNVSINSHVVITFDEAVSLSLDEMTPLTDNSIIINCTISGIQSYPQNDILAITVVDIAFNDFAIGDICTVTVYEFWIHDIDEGNHFDGNGDGFSDPLGDTFVSMFSVGEIVDPIFSNGFE